VEYKSSLCLLEKKKGRENDKEIHRVFFTNLKMFIYLKIYIACNTNRKNVAIILLNVKHTKA